MSLSWIALLNQNNHLELLQESRYHSEAKINGQPHPLQPKYHHHQTGQRRNSNELCKSPSKHCKNCTSPGLQQELINILNSASANLPDPSPIKQPYLYGRPFPPVSSSTNTSPQHYRTTYNHQGSFRIRNVRKCTIIEKNKTSASILYFEPSLDLN